MTALTGIFLTGFIFVSDLGVLSNFDVAWAPVLLALFAGGLLSIWGLGGASKIRRDGSKPADLAVMNARIFTSDDDNPWAEAVAVKDERITYVGDNEGIADYVGPNTRVIDARKNMMVPGFIDNHCHTLWIGALNVVMTNLYAAKSLDEMKAAISDHAEKTPELPFVIGIGWMYDYIPGGVPDKALADSIISDRPLFLWSYDGHTGWVNSSALELMEKRNPEALDKFGIEIDEKTGEPRGILHEFYLFNPLDFFPEEELGAGIRQKMLDNLEKTLNEALSYGVTTLNDVMIHFPFIPILLEFQEQGGFDNIRAKGSYYVHHRSLKDEKRFKNDLEYWKDIGRKHSDSHLLLGDSVKLGIDGVHGTHTSFMFEPFGDESDDSGEALWTQDDFNRAIEIIDGMGIQACTHACGDAGINRVINSYEYVRTTNGKRDSRHRVDHCELAIPEDRKRMAESAIYAAMQPCHFYADKSSAKAMGEERLQRYMPWRSLEEAGVNVSFGSDWCAGPMNPIYGFLIAGLRLNYKMDDDWGPEEKINIENILKHYTIDSAKALHMDDDVGSIEVGKFGDFVLFSIDLFDLTSWWFLLTHDLELGAMDDFVLFTVSGGEIVYHRKGEKF